MQLFLALGNVSGYPEDQNPSPQDSVPLNPVPKYGSHGRCSQSCACHVVHMAVCERLKAAGGRNVGFILIC